MRQRQRHVPQRPSRPETGSLPESCGRGGFAGGRAASREVTGPFGAGSLGLGRVEVATAISRHPA